MQSTFRALLLASAAAAVAAPAMAQAPISYGGRSAGGERAYAAALAGAGANSYGYGAQRGSAGSEGVLDLRRGAVARRPDPDLAAPPQDPPEAEDEAEPVSLVAPTPGSAPDWLADERVGPPYEVNGRWYVPTAEPGYAREGIASWYGPDFHGRQTASGEVYDQAGLTAAHPTLPLNSLVQVTNLENGREAILRVNDRGPFVDDRLIDVSRGAAEALDFAASGTARVHVRYLGPAPRRVGEGAPIPPSPQAAAAGAYVVQVGAFSSRTNAEAARTRAEAAGPVTVEPSGALYRVRVGGFASRAAAEAALAHMAALGFADAIVAAR